VVPAVKAVTPMRPTEESRAMKAVTPMRPAEESRAVPAPVVALPSGPIVVPPTIASMIVREATGALSPPTIAAVVLAAGAESPSEAVVPGSVPAPPEAMPLGWLVVRRSPDTARRGQLLTLAASDTVLSRRCGAESGESGESPRGAQGRVVFADEFMSGDHAVVRRGPASFVVQERLAGPTANGLFLNGRRLRGGKAELLADGDVLRLGATELVFKQVQFRHAQLPGDRP
jgi:hypothetical protein